MKVSTSSGKSVTLDLSNYVAQGGEAEIFVIGDKAYKKYKKPEHVVPEGKIKELSVLASNQDIIAPIEPIYDNNIPVGYVMRRIPQSITLCELLTKDYRTTHKVSNDQIANLVQVMHDQLELVHSHGFLGVDINLYNFLVSSDYKHMYFIDVDSYATPHYGSNALMASVKDWQAFNVKENKYYPTINSDWFSWGVTAFNLWTGISPFGGRHPDYGIRDMELRMQNNASVFDSKVILPGSVYPFTIIPAVYLSWFKAIFAEGKRLPPPTSFSNVVVVPVVTSTITKGSAIFTITLEKTLQENITRVNFLSGFYGPFIVDALSVYPIRVSQDNGEISIQSDGQNGLKESINSDSSMYYQGKIYFKSGSKLHRLDIIDTGNRKFTKISDIANVMVHSTNLYEGVALQDIMGSIMATFPAVEGTFEAKIPELNEYRIISAKRDSNILVVTGQKNGKLDRLVFKFYDKFGKHNVRITNDIQSTEVNFTVKKNGVVILINDNDELELFSSDFNLNDVKVIKDNDITSSCRIGSYGDQTYIAKRKELYKVSSK